jgi:transcription initiation factor TFIIH subunit 2
MVTLSIFVFLDLTDSCSLRLACSHQNLVSTGFVCPKCDALVCQVPRECPICALTLCSAPSLARSYHHIFPPRDFEEVSEGREMKCKGCGDVDERVEAGVECSGCRFGYCFDCAAFITEVLHSCPTCSL